MAKLQCSKSLSIKIDYEEWVNFPLHSGLISPPAALSSSPAKEKSLCMTKWCGFHEERKKRKRKWNKESLWGPTIPPYIPKGWTLGIKERFGKVTPMRPLIYRVPPTTFIQYITWMHSAFKCQKKSQHCFLIITKRHLLIFRSKNEEDPTVSAESAITSAAGVNFNQVFSEREISTFIKTNTVRKCGANVWLAYDTHAHTSCLALFHSTTELITITLSLNSVEAPLTRAITLTLFKQRRLINTSVWGQARPDSDSVSHFPANWRNGHADCRNWRANGQILMICCQTVFLFNIHKSSTS